MALGFIKRPGRQASLIEQIVLADVVNKKLGKKDKVVIHHITENTPYRLQLEVEAYANKAVSFHRLIIKVGEY